MELVTGRPAGAWSPICGILILYAMLLPILVIGYFASVASSLKLGLCSSTPFSLYLSRLNNSKTQTFNFKLLASTCIPLITDDASLCPDELLLEAWVYDSTNYSSSLSLMGTLMAASTTSPPDVVQILTKQPITVSLTSDAVASNAGYTYQILRMRIKGTNSQRLYVSLLNLSPITATFDLRAKCVVASDPPPCPSQRPDSLACPSPEQGLCEAGSCRCLNGYGGLACAQKILAIESSSSTLFPLPGGSWAYFSLDLLGSTSFISSENILLELTQPSGTYSTIQPLLIVTPINISSYEQGYTPDMGDIPPSFFTPRSMSPSNWLQPWSLSYYFEQSGSGNLSRYWSIGVFNAAPPLSTGPTTGILTDNLTLRVRAAPNQSPAVCPADCSGNGVCTYPQFYGTPQTILQCGGNGICSRKGVKS